MGQNRPRRAPPAGAFTAKLRTPGQVFYGFRGARNRVWRAMAKTGGNWRGLGRVESSPGGFPSAMVPPWRVCPPVGFAVSPPILRTGVMRQGPNSRAFARTQPPTRFGAIEGASKPHGPLGPSARGGASNPRSSTGPSFYGEFAPGRFCRDEGVSVAKLGRSRSKLAPASIFGRQAVLGKTAWKAQSVGGCRRIALFFTDFARGRTRVAVLQGRIGTRENGPREPPWRADGGVCP